MTKFRAAIVLVSALALGACVTTKERDDYYTAFSGAQSAYAQAESAKAQAMAESVGACQSDLCVLAVVALADKGSEDQGFRAPSQMPTNASYFWQGIAALAGPVGSAVVSYKQIDVSENIARYGLERERSLYGAFGTLAGRAIDAAGTHVNVATTDGAIVIGSGTIARDGGIAVGRDAGAIGQDGAVATVGGVVATDVGQAIGRDGFNARDEGRNASHDLDFPAGDCASGGTGGTSTTGDQSTGNTNCGTVIAAPITLPDAPDFSPPPGG